MGVNFEQIKYKMTTDYEESEYEDRDEENMFPSTEEVHNTEKRFRCDHCGKKRVENSTTLFPPFCCGRTMRFEHIVEKKFDFASIAERTIAKERAMYGKPPLKFHPYASSATSSSKTVKATKKAKVKAKPAKKAKKVKPKLKKAKPVARKKAKPTKPAKKSKGKKR